MRKRALFATAVLLLAAAAAVAIVSTREHATTRTTSPGQRAADPLSNSSLAARFAVLRQAHSNRCSMPASALNAMPRGARLQGSCCFPMDYHSYVEQRRQLSGRYLGVDVIPKDPYDIPVSLAKQLTAYQSIALTAEQQQIYNRAKPLSKTKGPCCCQCWRWTAFGGQAKYLITRRHYTAKQIADVWSLEDGCGGPGHSHD